MDEKWLVHYLGAIAVREGGNKVGLAMDIGRQGQEQLIKNQGC